MSRLVHHSDVTLCGGIQGAKKHTYFFQNLAVNVYDYKYIQKAKNICMENGGYSGRVHSL